MLRQYILVSSDGIFWSGVGEGANLSWHQLLFSANRPYIVSSTSQWKLTVQNPWVLGDKNIFISVNFLSESQALWTQYVCKCIPTNYEFN